MLKPLLYIVYFLFHSYVYSQNETIEYSNFSAVASHGKVLINWSIEAGSTCNGTEILRSSDNINFEPIGNIVGICGDPSFRSDYKFIDPSPVSNRINYYKLRFPPSDYTNSIAVEVLDFASTDYILRTNPIYKPEKIYFRDTGGDDATLNLINMKGMHTLQITTNQNFFLIDPALLQNGLYYFSITTGSRESIQGKFVIIK